jgi:hypothetical protein
MNARGRNGKRWQHTLVARPTANRTLNFEAQETRRITRQKAIPSRLTQDKQASQTITLPRCSNRIKWKRLILQIKSANVAHFTH